MKKRLGTAIGSIVLLGLLGGFMAGCAADNRPVSRPSSEVRRDSDRFFEKMREDERARGDGAERRP
jgi:hypothetical protein